MVLSGKNDAAMVDELYLASLGRSASSEERERGTRYLSGGARTMRSQDLLWALLNSKGFLYIY